MSSAGCTNEKSSASVLILNFLPDVSNLVTIKISDILALSKSLSSKGIIFDANSLAHIDSINEKALQTLNLTNLQTYSDYSLVNVETKILKEVENSKNNAVMLYVFSDNNMVNLKAVIGTNKKIKDKLKLDSNIKVKEKIYDTDTELIFTIKDSDKL